MDTAKLKKFAQNARRTLIVQVTANVKKVRAEDSTAQRAHADAVRKLEAEIKQSSEAQVIERVAYTWFNRFCALRFMDVNRYSRIGVVSPAPDQVQPEILAEAKMGHIDEALVPEKTRQQVFDLLSGKQPSENPQAASYRVLLVAVCNYWHKTMPFLFQRIDDYTELLIPEDLLSENSVLSATREAMSPEACQDVEVLGWLYQFYISEKKDEVFAGLKKNKKVTPENIPAATQLFTPHWIVRYLVENSLGRLWMLNRPESRLIEQMEYYVKPEEVESDFLRVATPEEIKVCDPACGSGHMLTYAFDLLYAIYEEEGYDPSVIPENILTHNLYGVEIDERAGELAAFALVMKARARQRRFFNRDVRPNICVLENVQFGEAELKSYFDFVGRDLFSAPLEETLQQFEEADNFGSLIRPRVSDVAGVRELLLEKSWEDQLFLSKTHAKVLKVLEQAEYLGQRYHVVVANPPYMGGKGMNGRLGKWLKDNYSDVKSDLFSAFIVRNTELSLDQGQLGFMTPFVWMFISSYEKLRDFIISSKTITSLVQLEYSGFDGATVPICTFTLQNSHQPDFRGGYVRLSDFRGSENQGPKTLEAIKNPNCGWFFRASTDDFKKIPGSPVAYWVSERVRDLFLNEETFESSFAIRAGISTGKNEVFILSWPEVTFGLIRKCPEHKYAYTPHNKGGEFRKWIGNWDTVLKYSQEHLDAMEKNPGFRHDGKEYYFQEHIGWSKITSSTSSFRFYHEGFTFDSAGLALFTNDRHSLYDAMGFLNSKVSAALIELLNPTLNVTPQILKKLPLIKVGYEHRDKYLQLCDMTNADWNSFETSWDFTALLLLNPDYRQSPLKANYEQLRAHWRMMTLKMLRLEQENNRIFINAYGLQNELTPEVPLHEITLTCNPHYRYDHTKTEAELEALLLADTMREFISYAVGCMLGRYSLDKPGLILANQGETIDDYLTQIPDPTFPPDTDNVIPMLDGNWFSDDITERFRKFLRITFGEEHFEENLRFLESALNTKNKRNYTIRDFFLKEFYDDHIKRYKKRPIYWLFSSPKGSFNALIYMHRYRPDTVSVVLNDYLREFRTKLIAHKNQLEAVSISANSQQAEKTKALKEIEKTKKTITELEDYERDVLYPLATQQIEIDLDDGVKVNYPKFGKALKKVAGLSA